MKNNEVIKQLKDLLDDRKTFMHGDYDDYLDKDVEALEHAIKIIETDKRIPMIENYLKQLKFEKDLYKYLGKDIRDINGKIEGLKIALVIIKFEI